MELFYPITVKEKKSYILNLSSHDNVAMYALAKNIRQFIARYESLNKYEIVPSPEMGYYVVLQFGEELNKQSESHLVQLLDRFNNEMDTELLSVPVYDSTIQGQEYMKSIIPCLGYISSITDTVLDDRSLFLKLDRKISSFKDFVQSVEDRVNREISNIIREKWICVTSINDCLSWELDLIDSERMIAKPNHKWKCYGDIDMYRIMTKLPIHFGEVQNRVRISRLLVDKGIDHYFYGKDLYAVITKFSRIKTIYDYIERVWTEKSKKDTILASNHPVMNEDNKIFIDYSSNLKYITSK